MTEKVSKEAIKKEKGFLYYLQKDGFVWASPMKKNTTGKVHKVGTEKITPDYAKFVYFVDKDGFVCRAERAKKKGSGEGKPAVKKAAPAKKPDAKKKK
jgi:hypothetical protein